MSMINRLIAWCFGLSEPVVVTKELVYEQLSVTEWKRTLDVYGDLLAYYAKKENISESSLSLMLILGIRATRRQLEALYEEGLATRKQELVARASGLKVDDFYRRATGGRRIPQRREVRDELPHPGVQPLPQLT